jgi:hypothetical protein
MRNLMIQGPGRQGNLSGRVSQPDPVISSADENEQKKYEESVTDLVRVYCYCIWDYWIPGLSKKSKQAPPYFTLSESTRH